MYLESIETLQAKETALKCKKEEAAILAKKEIAQAHSDGEARVRSAQAKADAEIAQMMREINEQAMASAEERAAAARNKRAVLQARAERNSANATALIIERIVNG